MLKYLTNSLNTLLVNLCSCCIIGEVYS